VVGERRMYLGKQVLVGEAALADTIMLQVKTVLLNLVSPVMVILFHYLSYFLVLFLSLL
jgi:hypothetical protein